MRRHDLDWLRVIVFGLLIFYHVGMFFVPWGWHIKNNILYEWLKIPMAFLHQWRLPILFVISGMGTAFALSFRSGGKFIKERWLRLGIPLIFGMLVIIPPQVYIERLYKGNVNASYAGFYFNDAFTQGVYPAGNISWHHLWFLPYLLVFSMMLTPVFLALRKHPNGKFLTWIRSGLQKSPYFLFWGIIPLYLYEAFLEPFFEVTHNLTSDWFNFISSLTFFFYGYLLIHVKKEFWSALDKIKSRTLLIGTVTFSLQLVIWYFIQDSLWVHLVEAAIKVTNIWAWIITIFGFAAKYLNRPSPRLTYLNQAVYPFYILHQTVTVIIGYFIYDSHWSFTPKFIIMVSGTFGVSWLIYEFLIRRIPVVWPLFGLKKIARTSVNKATSISTQHKRLVRGVNR
ncbi:acyltransferase family protein [Pleomorphovibrio marinus]|uniref:acyltransferase family protein n=1 Tax=Pleomorphovibrio marinus TaxID=2164132 RepID=UPI000E0A7E2A|nr:acyltransferase family protein [Pleomorphovibrio marinus]